MGWWGDGALSGRWICWLTDADIPSRQVVVGQRLLRPSQNGARARSWRKKGFRTGERADVSATCEFHPFVLLRLASQLRCMRETTCSEGTRQTGWFRVRSSDLAGCWTQSTLSSCRSHSKWDRINLLSRNPPSSTRSLKQVVNRINTNWHTTPYKQSNYPPPQSVYTFSASASGWKEPPGRGRRSSNEHHKFRKCKRNRNRFSNSYLPYLPTTPTTHNLAIESGLHARIIFCISELLQTNHHSPPPMTVALWSEMQHFVT